MLLLVVNFVTSKHVTYYHAYLGREMRTECLQACAKFPFRSSFACAKYYPGLWFLWIHSVVPNDSVSEHWRPWAYCADALADLSLRCPHMSEDTFSHGSAHLIVVNILLYKTVISDVFSHLGANLEILAMHHTECQIKYVQIITFRVMVSNSSL